MLSYRHAFHAGNHADVLKHLTLVLCCEHMIKKDKALCYVDTHAGAGIYNLQSEAALKNREYSDGIDRLTHLNGTPAVFNSYLSLVDLARKQHPHTYPGSPWFAAQILRPYDQLHLFELHPSDYQKLTKLFAADRRVKIKQQNGYDCLKSIFPPPSRRGLTLIDPPYEQELEYRLVLTSLKEGLKRFNTGTYIIWYPLINRLASTKSKASEKMLAQIRNDFSQEQLHVQLLNDKDGNGMYGSGLAILNPPWGLQEQLDEALKHICNASASEKSQYQIISQAVNQNKPRS
jgi:23S rRNA (adenine2030-N6)-methyltransferase